MGLKSTRRVNGWKPRLELKAAIIIAGMTQRSVGRAAQIEETRLSDIVRGVGATPSPREMTRIASALQTTASALFGKRAIDAALTRDR
jgi:transcriptional regulator with XRE-family HTH domain